MPFGTIARWISGDDPNKEARRAEQKQQTALNKEAKRVYKHELEIYNTNKQNYANEREYAYETAVTNWEYGKKIQDYQYAQSLASYEKSKGLYDAQLGYNQQASSLAISDAQAAIQDLELSQAFQREAMHAELMTEINKAGIQKLEQTVKLYGIQSNRRIGTERVQENLNEITRQNTFEKEAKYVEGLQKSGKAALGQSGVSRKKALQSTAAETFRSLVALDSSLSGARNKAAIDLLKLQVDASLGERQVDLTRDMIELNINSAKAEVEFNNRVLESNLQSAMGQMARNIQQIQLQKQGADLQAEANLNLFPEAFDYAPEPTMTPERLFVKPIKREAPKVPKGPRVATGFDSVLEVAGQVGNIVGSVVGLGNVANMFSGKNNVLGSFTSGKFGTEASPGQFTPGGTYDWSSGTSNVFGNMSGTTGGFSNFIT